MLAGLCNICYDNGYSNCDDIRALVHEISQQPGCVDAATTLKVFSDHQRYLATELAKQVSHLKALFYNIMAFQKVKLWKTTILCKAKQL